MTLPMQESDCRARVDVGIVGSRRFGRWLVNVVAGGGYQSPSYCTFPLALGIVLKPLQIKLLERCKASIIFGEGPTSIAFGWWPRLIEV